MHIAYANMINPFFLISLNFQSYWMVTLGETGTSQDM